MVPSLSKRKKSLFEKQCLQWRMSQDAQTAKTDGPQAEVWPVQKEFLDIFL